MIPRPIKHARAAAFVVAGLPQRPAVWIVQADDPITTDLFLQEHAETAEPEPGTFTTKHPKRNEIGPSTSIGKQFRVFGVFRGPMDCWSCSASSVGAATEEEAGSVVAATAGRGD